MNNTEKNSYVKTKITDSLLMLLKENKLSDISISEITEKAGVGRTSFYRNYKSKDDILRQYDLMLIKEWGKSFESNPRSNVNNLFGSLFQHYKNHADFYMILYDNNLTDMILDTIKDVSGPKAEMDNKEAYGKAFIAYGIYGWLMEWMSRGMKESEDEINAMLTLADSRQM